MMDHCDPFQASARVVVPVAVLVDPAAIHTFAAEQLTPLRVPP